MARPLPNSIDETQKLLASGDYVADRSLATSLFLALAMRRPLFLEGEAGVGKTEIGKVIAQGLGRELIRLQCYEGLDIAQAAYEWNYSRQMIEIRLAEAAGEKSKEKLAADIYSEKFLIKRPLARALEGHSPVLLIDELDRTDEPFEAYLLEVLSDWQITIPEVGTLRASSARREPRPPLEHRMSEGRLAENVMHFARLLRAAGLRIGSDRVIDCVRALEITGANQEVMRRDDWYWTMSAVLLSRPQAHREDDADAAAAGLRPRRQAPAAAKPAPHRRTLQPAARSARG